MIGFLGLPLGLQATGRLNAFSTIAWKRRLPSAQKDLRQVVVSDPFGQSLRIRWRRVWKLLPIAINEAQFAVPFAVGIER